MKNTQSITSYEELVRISKKESKPIIISLEAGEYPCLMSDVINDLANEKNAGFKLIKVCGPTALTIQTELNILKLPALILLNKESIHAIFQGLVSKQDIINSLNKI